ncbi:ABC transporter permease [Halanaerobiaceae bacterium Z-7014]|uniref:ABC transporter permease n=1 Tax=Halonatronomonas betaini TaxID=2778430 RepID=A0A931APG1_9FIRM|nr:ABC transporter permease [Halonatronomonas betaini]MBF8436067.1 ABC transporter permease [Halonatronomonas betaini]
MPSNPVDIYVNELISSHGISVEAARSRASALYALDLDMPVWRQYISYLGNLIQGNMGQSIRSPGVRVSTIIRARLPWTLFTVGSGLIISTILGIVLGTISAFKRDKWYEPIITGSASIISAIPDFLIGIFLIIFFGIITWFGMDRPLLPIQSMRGTHTMGLSIDDGFTYIRDIFAHGMFPIITYVLAQIGMWVLLMKGSTTSTLKKEYVKLAEARGLSNTKIMSKYVARNAFLPIATEFAMRMGFILGGSLIIEQLFVYEGLGLELLNAVHGRDYPVMQGILLIITACIVFSNLFAELIYGALDPRTRRGE